jgi:hypothetical protein
MCLDICCEDIKHFWKGFYYCCFFLSEVCFHFALETYTEENEATQEYKYFILEIFIPVKQVSLIPHCLQIAHV